MLRRPLLALPSLLLARTAAAQDTAPIRMIVSFGAGGTVDLVARLLAPRMSELEGRALVVENRAGGGGNTGTEAVINAPADGSVLLFSGTPTHLINPSLFRSMAFDPIAQTRR